jgi:hypothetical protein
MIQCGQRFENFVDGDDPIRAGKLTKRGIRSDSGGIRRPGREDGALFAGGKRTIGNYVARIFGTAQAKAAVIGRPERVTALLLESAFCCGIALCPIRICLSTRSKM